MLPLQYSFEKYNDGSKEMHQSVVIKARVVDQEEVESAVFDLTDSLGTHFLQEDVYFPASHGQLKLRIMHPNRCGQLIFHSTSKKLGGPKVSATNITEVEDVFSMRATLSAAMGELGVITKRRRVFIADNVRIYLDDVDNIGQFVDIAISCKSGDPKAAAQQAEDIRKKLCINENDIVPVAYLDLMINSLDINDDKVSDSSSIKDCSIDGALSSDDKSDNEGSL